jgi:hypothetical protein
MHTGGLKTPIERRKTTARGAATSVLLAASPILEGIGGRYFEDCNEAPVSEGVRPISVAVSHRTRWTPPMRSAFGHSGFAARP